MDKKVKPSPELSSFRVILVRTKTPGNIGAVARGLANFSCSDLRIVNPQCESDELMSSWAVKKFATGNSEEVLSQAKVESDLFQTLEDCHVAVGFTRRLGGLRKPSVKLEELAEWSSPGKKIALVFGNEENGLSSEEAELCTHLCSLSTSPAMPSLNLSHAVLIVLSRIYEKLSSGLEDYPPPEKSAGVELREFEGMLSHAEEFLKDIGLTQEGQAHRMVLAVRKLFLRAKINRREIRVIRAVFSKTQVKLGTRRRGKRVV